MSTREKWFFFGAIPTAVGVIILGILFFVSVGSSSPTVASPNAVGENPPPGIELPVAVDLNGNWMVNDEGRVFTAEITSETITITLSKGNTSVLYWYGSFDPTIPVGQIVVSDKLESDKMIVSRADSKDFLVGDNRLSFEFTVMGVTKKLELQRA